MADPDFDVSRYFEYGDSKMTSKVEFVVYTNGTIYRSRLSPGNAILFGKKLQREGEEALAERKKK